MSGPATPLVCIVPNPSIDRTAEVDRLEPGRIHRPSDVVAVPGGKGLNVARAARNLGLPVEAVLLLAGHAGRWIADELQRLELPFRAAWSAGETRTCLSVLDRSTGLLTEVYEPGPVVSQAEWDAFIEEIRGAVAGHHAGSWVALSGSLPRGAPDGAAAAIVTVAGASGQVLVDTSGAHLIDALTARPFLAKVNAAEAGPALRRTIRTEADAARAARDLVAAGARQAVVTRGRDGAVAWDGAAAWAVDAPGDAGPHTVGSGDAFLAGFAAGLAGGEPFPEALRRAAATAAASTLRVGPGNLVGADAEELLGATTVRRLD